MKKGIATSLFVNFPISEAIHRIAKAGYECVDIWGGRPHIYRKDFSPLELRNLRSEIEGRGMAVSSFMPAFFRYPYNLCSPNARVRKDTLGYVYQCLENAVELGAPILLVCPPRLLFGQNISSAWDQMASSLRLICDSSNQYGIKVVLEPVNKNVFDLINNTADAMRMIHYLDIDTLGVVLDTGHLHLSDETIAQALSQVKDRLYQVHINDNNGKQQQNLIPGEGTFNFEEFFSGLHQIGFNGVVSAELSTDYGMQLQQAIEVTSKRLSNWLKE